MDTLLWIPLLALHEHKEKQPHEVIFYLVLKDIFWAEVSKSNLRTYS